MYTCTHEYMSLHIHIYIYIHTYDFKHICLFVSKNVSPLNNLNSFENIELIYLLIKAACKLFRPKKV